jgi:hypothetical protein
VSFCKLFWRTKLLDAEKNEGVAIFARKVHEGGCHKNQIAALPINQGARPLRSFSAIVHRKSNATVTLEYRVQGACYGFLGWWSGLRINDDKAWRRRGSCAPARAEEEPC